MKELEIFKRLNKRYMKDANTDILTDGKRYIVVNDRKWNGDKYFDCFEIKENLIDIVSDKKYEIIPVYKEENEEFIVIGYELYEEI